MLQQQRKCRCFFWAGASFNRIMPRRNRNFCAACYARSLLLQIVAGLNYGRDIFYLACVCRQTILAKAAAAATAQLCIFFGAISLSFTSHARGYLYTTYCLLRRYRFSLEICVYDNLCESFFRFIVIYTLFGWGCIISLITMYG